MALLDVDAARAVMLGAVARLPAEHVALGKAGGRTLAQPVLARRDQPPFESSAMDGWAVCGLKGATLPLRLNVVGESAAGAGYYGAVTEGNAVRVFTGAPVPVGADCVVMQEHARREGSSVWIDQLGNGGNIRPRGGDFTNGAVLLSAGQVLNAAALGVAASAGAATVAVAQRPCVVLITMGAELVAPESTPRDDQIYESNTAALASLVSSWGGLVSVLPIEGDSVGAIAEAVRPVLGEADVIVVIGGASVGDYDFAKPALDSLGLGLLVDKIAVRPGKPTWFGTLPDGQAVLGLPGNPASAQVCAHLFLQPIIAHILGLPTGHRLIPARTTISLLANGDREHWMRARISVSTEGFLEATAFRDQDSSLQTVLAAANGLVRREIGAPALDAGGLVDCLLTGLL